MHRAQWISDEQELAEFEQDEQSATSNENFTDVEEDDQNSENESFSD